MTPTVKTQSIEQIAQRICTSRGIDYRDLSDSAKQAYLILASKG